MSFRISIISQSGNSIYQQLKSKDPGIEKPGSFFDVCSVNTLIDKKIEGFLIFPHFNDNFFTTVRANHHSIFVSLINE